VKEFDVDDIRWQQRLANYQRALAQLQKAVKLRQITYAVSAMTV
jgi:hypothetical protein